VLTPAIAVAQALRRDRAQQLDQDRLVRDDRATAKVATVEVQDVEGEEGERCRVALLHDYGEVVEVLSALAGADGRVAITLSRQVFRDERKFVLPIIFMLKNNLQPARGCPIPQQRRHVE
jgi:hypothetical protein